MSIENKLLTALKTAQVDFATGALRTPSKCDAFEYGQRCGHMSGLETAINILINLLKDEQDDDSKL